MSVSISLASELTGARLTNLSSILLDLNSINSTFKGDEILTGALVNSTFLSAVGELIKEFENISLQAYDDGLGNITIGYGFNLDKWGEGVAAGVGF